MKKSFRLIATMAATMIPMGCALAADLAPPPPPDLRMSTYDWTGAYVGVNGGYAFGGDDRVGLNPTFGNIGKLENSGYFGGGQVGYNIQGHGFVVGAEADMQWSWISDDNTVAPFTMSSDINYFGTLRSRAGIALDNALFYVTGGIAYADIDYSIVGAGGSLKANYGDWGYAVGGGVEYAFGDSWSAKAEYLYVGLGNKSLTSGGETTVASPSVHTARIGVNYRF
ncbi:MAG TPA: porin family protein [Aestuariivirga sp.]|nr:porin family protein [Aestuariivirga sp.]